MMRSVGMFFFFCGGGKVHSGVLTLAIAGKSTMVLKMYLLLKNGGFFQQSLCDRSPEGTVACLFHPGNWI